MSEPYPDRPAIVGATREALELARAWPGAALRLPPGARHPKWPPGATSAGQVTADWLAGTGAACLVIAPHPFDADTADAAVRAARATGTPFVLLRRGGWALPRGVRVTRLRRAADLVRHVPQGARVFAATGREDVAALRRLRARVTLRLVSTDDPAPIRGLDVRAGRPPFTVAGEMRLLRRLRADWLVLRDAGGPGAWPKLEAARRLGLGIALIDRPAWPSGPDVRTTEEASRWIARTMASAASS